MRITLFTLTLLFSLAATAEIYSWKDANGNMVFGDTPPEAKRAKKIETQPLTVIPSFKDPSLEKTEEKPKEDKDKGEAYESFEVAYPSDDATIRSNDGNLSISLDLSPSLQSSHLVFIYVDGKKVIEEGSTSLSASLNNLDRGTHSLFAVVRSEDGDVLINSNTVKFHIQRNSMINSNSTNAGNTEPTQYNNLQLINQPPPN
ncbi:MAG: Unknown protein [uncultured Thiotrichaceae bacterium]|uniref:DUF4124 domain-containing protein n=1 Tax=uncultured Thiotrichaceae bacterium TaxID=298394 RepID=A0A6S6TR48_9GAMM|nr:MAG: Unknown protein [uncultured Thiotrichaceae bacterium]